MTAKTRQKAPDLDVELVGGGRFRLADARPEKFTLVIVYRGLHCPICNLYLNAFNDRIAAFNARGVDIIAVSADPRDRAEEAKAQWGIDNILVAYGLGIDGARQWGLFISNAIREGEPPIFTEPGLFLIDPDGNLRLSVLNSAPHLRPYAEDVLATIDHIIERGRPARGEA